VFSDDPVEMALRWQSMGAPRLHIVDLDGAAAGEPRNLDIVKELASAILVPTQLGGGIRSMETIKMLLEAGIERVILGTAAVEDPELVKEACQKYRDAIIVGIDTREGWVATHGWLKETRIEAAEFARSMIRFGVKRFIYTDISRDGTLTEPNFTAIAELIDDIRAPVIASGGIAIVGRALYTDDINLKEALAELDRQDRESNTGRL
jgi:phosphoribosylformimino-5-aminoimidazole carboxamide ribotide isomerase